MENLLLLSQEEIKSRKRSCLGDMIRNAPRAACETALISSILLFPVLGAGAAITNTITNGIDDIKSSLVYLVAGVCGGVAAAICAGAYTAIISHNPFGEQNYSIASEGYMDFYKEYKRLRKIEISSEF